MSMELQEGINVQEREGILCEIALELSQILHMVLT